LREGCLDALASPAEIIEKAGLSAAEPRALSKAFLKLVKDRRNG
jgi:hypothetical protein